jgi:putative thioredoxin
MSSQQVASPSANPVREITTADFATAVVERSRTVPVVVDFWAPWCGPCRVLGPLLEREVAALGGKVEMVKIDTDQNPDLSAALQIQGIPAVKAFVGGQVADEFVGAQSLETVRAFLGRLVPSEASVKLGQARAAVADHRPDDAARLLADVLDDRQLGDEALWELARLEITRGRADEAAPLIDRLEQGPLADRALSLRRLAGFAAEAAAFGGPDKARAALAADEKNWQARYALACALATAGDYGGALEQLLTIVARQRKFRDDAARLAMLALFEHLGPENELVQHYRRQLQIVT